MPIARKIAVGLLSVAARRSSPQGEEWGSGMLRELDFIESDWSALGWALGGVTALFRQLVRVQIWNWLRGNWLRGQRAQSRQVQILSGVIMAGGILTVCVYGVSQFVSAFFAEWRAEHALLAGWLPVLVIPETAYCVIAALLWRARKRLAAGVLLGGVALAAHVAIHVITHG